MERERSAERDISERERSGERDESAAHSPLKPMVRRYRLWRYTWKCSPLSQHVAYPWLTVAPPCECVNISTDYSWSGTTSLYLLTMHKASNLTFHWHHNVRLHFTLTFCSLLFSLHYLVIFFKPWPTYFSERELTFTFAKCHRPSVCLSSVCNVRAPYSGDWNFRQCFYTIWYAGHLLTSR